MSLIDELRKARPRWFEDGFGIRGPQPSRQKSELNFPPCQFIPSTTSAEELEEKKVKSNIPIDDVEPPTEIPIQEHVDGVYPGDHATDPAAPFGAVSGTVAHFTIDLDGSGDTHATVFHASVRVDGTLITFGVHGTVVTVPLPGVATITVLADPGQNFIGTSDIVFEWHVEDASGLSLGNFNFVLYGYV